MTTYRIKSGNEFLTDEGWRTLGQVTDSQGANKIWFFDTIEAAKNCRKELGLDGRKAKIVLAQ